MLHINRFIDKIKASEAKQLRNINLSLQEAKDLHSDITRLLIVMEELRERMDANKEETDTTIEVSGGSF